MSSIVSYSSAPSRALADGVAVLAGFSPQAGMWDAAANRRSVTDGAITAADATLSSATAGFTAADVGKTVLIKGAGAANDDIWLFGWHITTIATYTDPSHVELATPATTTVSGALVVWGTDATAALQTAIDAVKDPKGLLTITAGDYLITAPLVIDHAMTLCLERVSIWGHVDLCLDIQAGGVTIDGGERSTSTIETVKGIGNAIYVRQGAHFCTIRNITATAPPRWYQEDHLFQANAIYAGGSSAANHGTGADQSITRGLVVERCKIASGQNGVIFVNCEHSKVTNCYFDCTDKTGTRETASITFKEYPGLAHVLFYGCRFCKITNNEMIGNAAGMTGSAGRFPNAVYIRQDDVTGHLPCMSNEATDNVATGEYGVEVFNTFCSGTRFQHNTVNLSGAGSLTSAIAFQGNSRKSEATGNSIYIPDNASHYGLGILVYGTDATYGSYDVAISGNNITVPVRAVFCFDHSYHTLIDGNTIELLATTGEMDAIRVTTGCQYPMITNNKIRGAGRAIRAQGTAIGATIRNNEVYSPSVVGILVEEGAGQDFVIAANRIISPATYGVSIAASATGPVLIGHNYITGAGTAEYNRAIAAIYPERHQDANVQQVGIGTDPAHMLHLRDDAIGNYSQVVEGNSYRRIKMLSSDARNLDGSETMCAISAHAQKGTVASPSAAGSNHETFRGEGLLWDGSAWQNIGQVAIWGGISAGHPTGYVNLLARKAGDASPKIRMCIMPDGEVEFRDNFTVTAMVDETGKFYPCSGGWFGSIGAGNGAPSYTPAGPGLYFQQDAASDVSGIWEYQWGAGWKLVVGGPLKGDSLVLDSAHPFFRMKKGGVLFAEMSENGQFTIDSAAPSFTIKKDGTTVFSADLNGNTTAAKGKFDGPTGANPFEVYINGVMVLWVTPLGILYVSDFVVGTGGQALINGDIILNNGSTGGKLLRTNASTLALEEVDGYSGADTVVTSVTPSSVSAPITTTPISTAGMNANETTIANAVNTLLSEIGSGTLVKGIGSATKTITTSGGAVTDIS